jgi:hypothetical protein
MTMHTNPNDRRHIRERAGMSAGTIATFAVLAALAIGGLIFALSGDDTTTASTTRTEQSVPPATTGQGGAQSKMPQKSP